LGYALQLRGDVAGAVEAYQKAVELTEGKDWRFLDLLAQAYEKSARYSDAVNAGQRALDLAVQERDPEAPVRLKTNLDRYASGSGQSSPK
jgi:Flp pilus assembly protein TadD